MKKPTSYLLFTLGAAGILLAALAALRLLHRYPLIASLTGIVLLTLAALALLRHRLPPLLCPRRTAERQLAALLQRSPQTTLLYYDTPEEDAGPALLLSARLEHREGLTAFRLSLPADHPDLPGLLSLPPGAELTAVFPLSPTQNLQFTGTASPLPASGSRRTLLFTPQAFRLPHHSRPIPIQK